MVRKTKEQARETRRQIIDAATAVFHRRGLSRSSLDMVAREAGLTRGAIYWHFKDKAELFLAVRENVLSALQEEIGSIIGSGGYADPLDGIEAALGRCFQVLEDRPGVKMVLETIFHRCEHVAEFADLRSDLDGPAWALRARLEDAYREAAAFGSLRPGLEPKLIARDTWAFAYGLLYRLLAGDADGGIRNHVGEMISIHMALRRASPTQCGKALETAA